MKFCNLPDSIALPDGTKLRPVIGGHLQQKPFLTKEGAGVDVTTNGWLSSATVNDPDIDRWERNQIIAEAKRQRLKFRRVQVLSRNLRGKNDLHGRAYQGTNWVFVEVKP